MYCFGGVVEERNDGDENSILEASTFKSSIMKQALTGGEPSQQTLDKEGLCFSSMNSTYCLAISSLNTHFSAGAIYIFLLHYFKEAHSPLLAAITCEIPTIRGFFCII
ncbi:hypothetical protein HHK36_013831 [Tetracentron sinense]|uniref:Uncharacterized protein n=1 Tax=Tetracentron sinense TaxID=13715 RepID=A0A835DH41_TETSI|nr:hypothetical protein HHK36_013831 [Tetracentron sinense]